MPLRLQRDRYALSGPVELISMPLDHKLCVGEGIGSILDFIASINSSKNIFDAGFGEKLSRYRLPFKTRPNGVIARNDAKRGYSESTMPN